MIVLQWWSPHDDLVTGGQVDATEHPEVSSWLNVLDTISKLFMYFIYAINNIIHWNN